MENQNHSKKNVVENSTVSAGGDIHIGDIYNNNPKGSEPEKNKKSDKAIFCSVLIVALGVSIGFLGELMSDNMKAALETWVTANLGISFLKFWFLMTLVMVLLLLWLTWKEALGNEKRKNTVKDFEPEIRNWLKKRYENRLDQKMAGRLPINLRRIDFSEHAAQISPKQFNEIAPEEVEAELNQFFKTAEGRLLVVGAPGAGKTTLLLQLAVGLLETESDSLPAVINLASWSNEFKTLDEWLKKILPDELGVSTTLAVRLLAESRVILLFDGLDEIPNAEERTTCLAAIDLFVSPVRPRREFAISSRTQEFGQTGRMPLVSFPVEVGALNIMQIERGLTQRNPAQSEDRDLLAALRADAVLCEAAETPFYFNCLQLLFAENSQPVFSTVERIEREQEILNAFVENELGKCKTSEARSWLAFLAEQMDIKDLVKFELRDLQYHWSSWNVLTLIISGIIHFIILWIYLLLITLLLISLFFLLTSPYPTFITLNAIKMVIGSLFILFIIIGVFQGLLRQRPIIEVYEINPSKLLLPKFKNLPIIAAIICFFLFRSIEKLGLIKGILLSIPFILMTIINFGITRARKPQSFSFPINAPYKRFFNSNKVLHFSIFLHLLLRCQLAKKRLLPLRLVGFLNEMADYQVKSRRFTCSSVHLLESDGASWRFRHRLIQEWFEGSKSSETNT